jgi:hypothetical protein
VMMATRPKYNALLVVALSAILSSGCSDEPSEQSIGTGPLPTAAPSTESECREVVAGHASTQPDLDPVRAVTGEATDEAVDRAYDASITWTAVIADTYECAAKFGPQPGGDTVLARHAAALWLARLALDDSGIDAAINTAIVGLHDFYPDSCYAGVADTWEGEGRLDLDLLAAC